MMQFALVFLGSGLGGVFRFGIYKIQTITNLSFPIATLFCNLFGSIAIVLLMPLIKNSNFKVFFITGVLGGFTTYSTFAFELLSTQYKIEYTFCNLLILFVCFVLYIKII